VALVQAKKTADGPSIAIVGVTGAVGQEFLQVWFADCCVAAAAAVAHLDVAGLAFCRWNCCVSHVICGFVTGAEGEELPLPQHQAAG